MSIGRIIGVLGFLKGAFFPEKKPFVDLLYDEFIRGELDKITWRQIDQLQNVVDQKQKDENWKNMQEKWKEMRAAVDGLFDIAEKTMPDEDVKAICRKEGEIIYILYKMDKDGMINTTPLEKQYLQGKCPDEGKCASRDFAGVKKGITFKEWSTFVVKIIEKVKDVKKKETLAKLCEEKKLLKKNYRKKKSGA
jgi:hypothetical protein